MLTEITALVSSIFTLGELKLWGILQYWIENRFKLTTTLYIRTVTFEDKTSLCIVYMYQLNAKDRALI